MPYQVIPILLRAAPTVTRKLIKESPKIYKKISEGLGHNLGGKIVKSEVEVGRKIKEKKVKRKKSNG